MATTAPLSPFDIHPKISRAGLAGGAALIVAGIFEAIGVPAPGWVAPLVTILVALLAGYLKASA